MSALWKAEIHSLQRLIAAQNAEAEAERERQTTSAERRATLKAIDLQAVQDVLNAVTGSMTSQEIANRAGVPRQRTRALLDQLVQHGHVTRRRRPQRRPDKQGTRSVYRYTAVRRDE